MTSNIPVVMTFANQDSEGKSKVGISTKNIC